MPEAIYLNANKQQLHINNNEEMAMMADRSARNMSVLQQIVPKRDDKPLAMRFTPYKYHINNNNHSKITELMFVIIIKKLHRNVAIECLFTNVQWFRHILLLLLVFCGNHLCRRAALGAIIFFFASLSPEPPPPPPTTNKVLDCTHTNIAYAYKMCVCCDA